MTHRLRGYVVRETAISIVINAAISAVFAWAMFHGAEPVSVSGAGGLAFDFLPQTFMIALMSSLVPSAIARKRLRPDMAASGHAAPGRLPRNLLLRALLIAAAATLLIAPAASFLLAKAAGASLDGGAVMPMKVAYGAFLALLVTPAALRAELRMQGWTS
jgi:hypothetical protein